MITARDEFPALCVRVCLGNRAVVINRQIKMRRPRHPAQQYAERDEHRHGGQKRIAHLYTIAALPPALLVSCDTRYSPAIDGPGRGRVSVVYRREGLHIGIVFVVLYADLAASAEPSAKISGLLGKPIVGHAPGTAIARYFDGLIVYCTAGWLLEADLVGPPGFEPGTKGFAVSAVSRCADYLFTRASSARVRDALACH